MVYEQSRYSPRRASSHCDGSLYNEDVNVSVLLDEIEVYVIVIVITQNQEIK